MFAFGHRSYRLYLYLVGQPARLQVNGVSAGILVGLDFAVEGRTVETAADGGESELPLGQIKSRSCLCGLWWAWLGSANKPL
jgi:hypothetical protein